MQFRDLSLEEKEEILLQASPEELLTLCSDYGEFYFLCSDSTFWRRRFRQGGLPLLEERVWASLGSRQEWVKLFHHAILSEEDVLESLERLREGETLFLDPAALSTPLPLLFLPMKSSAVIELWKSDRLGKSSSPLVLRKEGTSYRVEVKTEGFFQSKTYFFFLTEGEIERLLYHYYFYLES